eukprot:gene458-240_t
MCFARLEHNNNKNKNKQTTHHQKERNIHRNESSADQTITSVDSNPIPAFHDRYHHRKQGKITILRSTMSQRKEKTIIDRPPPPLHRTTPSWCASISVTLIGWSHAEATEALERFRDTTALEENSPRVEFVNISPPLEHMFASDDEVNAKEVVVIGPSMVSLFKKVQEHTHENPGALQNKKEEEHGPLPPPTTARVKDAIILAHARLLGIPCVHHEWVTATGCDGQQVAAYLVWPSKPPFTGQQLPVEQGSRCSARASCSQRTLLWDRHATHHLLAGAFLCTSGLSSEERRAVEAMARDVGASFQRSLTRRCNLLVVPILTKEKKKLSSRSSPQGSFAATAAGASVACSSTVSLPFLSPRTSESMRESRGDESLDSRRSWWGIALSPSSAPSPKLEVAHQLGLPVTSVGVLTAMARGEWESGAAAAATAAMTIHNPGKRRRQRENNDNDKDERRKTCKTSKAEHSPAALVQDVDRQQHKPPIDDVSIFETTTPISLSTDPPQNEELGAPLAQVLPAAPTPERCKVRCLVAQDAAKELLGIAMDPPDPSWKDKRMEGIQRETQQHLAWLQCLLMGQVPCSSHRLRERVGQGLDRDEQTHRSSPMLIQLVTSPEECTHYVVAHPSKTPEILCCMARGVWMEHPAFLKACVTAAATSAECSLPYSSSSCSTAFMNAVSRLELEHEWRVADFCSPSLTAYSPQHDIGRGETGGKREERAGRVGRHPPPPLQMTQASCGSWSVGANYSDACGKNPTGRGRFPAGLWEWCAAVEDTKIFFYVSYVEAKAFLSHTTQRVPPPYTEGDTHTAVLFIEDQVWSREELRDLLTAGVLSNHPPPQRQHPPSQKPSVRVLKLKCLYHYLCDPSHCPSRPMEGDGDHLCFSFYYYYYYYYYYIYIYIYIVLISFRCDETHPLEMVRCTHTVISGLCLCWKHLLAYRRMILLGTQRKEQQHQQQQANTREKLDHSFLYSVRLKDSTDRLGRRASPPREPQQHGLPENYRFEIEKCVKRIKEKEATRVALQFPEGLLLFAASIADILETQTGAEMVILGDVTYGACCVDDFAAKALGCDFLIHYGHSCLISIKDCLVPNMMYVFVEIDIDLQHLIDTVTALVPSDTRLACIATVQFISSMRSAMKTLQTHFTHPIVVPQMRPLSTGEILGCTSPLVDPSSVDLVLYVGDGRFHLESFLIAHPTLEALQYDPYKKELTKESYNNEEMRTLRKEAVELGKKATSFAIIMGTLGRQGHPRVVDRILRLAKQQNKRATLLLMSEIFPQKLAQLQDVDCYIQVALQATAWSETTYPMDHYSQTGGPWAVYTPKDRIRLEQDTGMRQSPPLPLPLPHPTISVYHHHHQQEPAVWMAVATHIHPYPITSATTSSKFTVRTTAPPTTKKRLSLLLYLRSVITIRHLPSNEISVIERFSLGFIHLLLSNHLSFL